LAPETALKRAISDEMRNRLPASIAVHLEREISAYGDLQVYQMDLVDHSNGKLTGHRTERLAGNRRSKYKAFVFGRRESMTTKLRIPLHGVVLEDVMAVDEHLCEDRTC
jgi:hypothetical protein